MSTSVLRVVKVAALLCAATSVLSLLALFSVEPNTGWTTIIADNALLVLAVSTPVAAGLLSIVSRGWTRAVALCAFVPGAVAIGLIALIELVPSLQSLVLAATLFVLVELAMPATAVLVGVVAAALVVRDVSGAISRRPETATPS